MLVELSRVESCDAKAGWQRASGIRCYLDAAADHFLVGISFFFFLCALCRPIVYIIRQFKYRQLNFAPARSPHPPRFWFGYGRLVTHNWGPPKGPEVWLVAVACCSMHLLALKRGYSIVLRSSAWYFSIFSCQVRPCLFFFSFFAFVDGLKPMFLYTWLKGNEERRV